MRNPEVAKLDVLVGNWTLTMSNAWFLEPQGAEWPGSGTGEWLGEAFVVLRLDLGGELVLVLGRSDPHEAFTALYHDERGMCRVFAMTFDGTHWTLTRQDPDFHQRFVAEVTRDRIAGRWEASEDAGQTWRKDYDLVFERT